MKFQKLVVVIIIILFFTHCADLMKVVQKGSIEEPHVRISSTKLTELTFEQADLVFDIEINNPNPIGISLAGFEYDLLLNKSSFLKGEQNKQMEIKANDTAMIQLPLSLLYENIYKTFERLKDEDNITYKLNAGLSFSLPVLGDIRIPVSTSGEFPAIKLPAVSIKYLKMSRLSLTGANFNLAIGVNNPNSFGLNINRLQYSLSINHAKWADGLTTERMRIQGKNDNTLIIPITLNFLHIGTSLHEEISNGRSLNYHFNGQANLSSSLEMFAEVDLPFDVTGKIDLTR